MKTVLLVITGLILGIPGRSRPNIDSFGKPIVWVIKENPWAIFIGADDPKIAIYQSGKVIYRKNNSFHLAQLSKERLASLLNDLHLDLVCGDIFP